MPRTADPRPRLHLGGRLAATAVIVLVGLLGPAVVSAWADSTVDSTVDRTSTDDGAVDTDAAGRELTAGKALVLGVVEGITEYLPVSSTGHLVVTQRILDVGQADRTEAAMDSYTIVIQLGAILAVLVLYRERVVELWRGLLGRSVAGRRLLLAVLLAFVPAAAMALALGDVIDEHLLDPGPVAVAWIVGAGVIFATLGRFRDPLRGKALELLGPRQALLIGVAQAFALWPGVSRSFVTILGGLFVGLTLPAAVEFSFLLGLATLGAATGYELLTNGSTITDAYGLGTPLLGVLAALVSAALAVKWLVAYLNRHDLALFGWYRLAIGVATLVLLGTGAI